MKALEIITHPLTVIISFLCVLIIGQHVGGFYLLYILSALPHGSLHAVIAVIGILALLICLLFSLKINHQLHSLLNITGVVLLPLSLFIFFHRDKDRYNEATFNQIIPLIILGIFITLVAIFLITNFIKLVRGTTLRQPGC